MPSRRLVWRAQLLHALEPRRVFSWARPWHGDEPENTVVGAHWAAAPIAVRCRDIAEASEIFGDVAKCRTVSCSATGVRSTPSERATMPVSDMRP
jgi:hypothetical protein